MNYCKIENGIVVDRALFETAMPSDWPDYASWVQTDEAQIGWSHADGVFTPPPPPPPILPPPPTQNEIVLFNHENRLRAQEGTPPLTLEDFVEKKRTATL